jgi:RecJ-like exonuclease
MYSSSVDRSKRELTIVVHNVARNANEYLANAFHGCSRASNHAMNKRKVSLIIFGAIMSVMLASCEREKISDIKADPGRFQGKTVNIAGEVTQSIGALGKGVYQISDGTGSLWVYSDTFGVPSRGAHVGVRGSVIPTFTFLGINYATVLRESDRARTQWFPRFT